jgi:hypothetical protein
MKEKKPSPDAPKRSDLNNNELKKPAMRSTMPKEHGGYESQGLLEPTRYGDWDVKGRCSDF